MVLVRVHVTPKAAAAGVGGWRGGELLVRVSSAPEGGKANAAACAAVAEALGIAKSRVRVVRGATSRHKVLEVQDVVESDVREAFGEPDEQLF